MRAIIFSDGGSRGNPGNAAVGYTIQNSKREAIYECGMNIGIATNNVAEYTAIIEALKKAKELKFDEISVFLDSQLVEKQVKGEYRVKSPELMPLFERLIMEIKSLKSFEMNHVKRELNKRADKLVNEALDSEKHVIYDYSDKLALETDEVIEDTDILEKLKGLFISRDIQIDSIKELKSVLVVIIDRNNMANLPSATDEVNEMVKNSKFKKLFYEIK